MFSGGGLTHINLASDAHGVYLDIFCIFGPHGEPKMYFVIYLFFVLSCNIVSVFFF